MNGIWGKTNNHYLSNIAGLVFLSSYLYSHNEEIDKNIIDIYNFSKRQFYLEVQKQFNKDGGNFENSSTYLITFFSLHFINHPLHQLINFLKTNRWWDENSLNRKTLISMFQKTFNVKKDLFDETFESKIVEKFINKPLSIKCSKPKINIKKKLKMI